MSLPGKTDLEKFDALSKFNHKDQLIWCLNGLWEKVGAKDAEKFWVWWNKFCELDLKNRVDGNELDELNAHRFYEQQNNTHTVKELRDKLREIGWERRPMMFPAVVFVILEYKVDWHMVVNAAQGDNKEELAQAKKLLDEVQALLDDAIAKADTAAKASRIAQEKAETARVAEAPLKAAEEEVKAALSEVKSQEDARDRKTKELTELSQGTGVKAGKAKQELAQHLGADPLPLRKAKITLEAANRKAEKLRAPFKAAREAAEEAAVEAERTKEAANAAVDEANAKVAEAQAYLEEIKKKPGSAQGALWFAERELAYRKSFLPKHRQ